MISSKAKWISSVSIVGLLAAPGLAVAAADGPIATAPPAPTVETVVVTGSFIAGTAKNTAMPVDVVSAKDIAKQGYPSTLELIKSLPISSGVIGETNPYVAGRGSGADGQSTVNLRGFGPQRTLVLLNGKRLTPTDQGFVDSNALPTAVIGRIEVLKDGAAATYGSDAVAGVVNFITRKDIKGLELAADYTSIAGSQGDYDGSAAWGWSNGPIHVTLSAGYQHRSDLALSARHWALRPFQENPQGGWTGAPNPSRFVPVGANYAVLGPAQLDPGCAVLGEVLTNPVPSNAPASQMTASGFTACRGSFTQFSNLVDEQSRFQVYGDFDAHLSDTTSLHVELLSSHTLIPSANRAPSFTTSRPVPATVLPTGFPGLNTAVTPATSGNYYVPLSNPGFAAFIAQNPGLFPAGTTGAFIPVGTWRPFLSGGSPIYDGGAGGTKYTRDESRLSAELKGTLPDSFIGHDVQWSTGATYGRYVTKTFMRDTLNARLELALRGLGGPNCDYTTGTPGVGGCLYYNPFSTALAGNPARGTTNPGYVASTANSAALQDWLMPKGTYSFITTLWVYDIGATGTTGLELPGGAVKWAVGGQFRQNELRTTYSVFNSTILSPCADFPINGDKSCSPQPISPLVSELNGTPIDLKQRVGAVYGELSLPFFETLNASLAARYEDYSGSGGSTFNPEFRAKWQALPWLAFRGSAGTTFRAPPQASLDPSSTITVQQIFGTSIPVEVKGNPALRPETAFSYDIGVILEKGGLHASIDYWNYDFKNLLTSEPLNNVLSAGFGRGGPCIGDPAFIASHFGFSSGCNSSTLTRVSTTQINGPEVKTSGVDFLADYDWPDVFGGDLDFGGSATYTREYKVGTLVVGGVPVAGSAFDAVGDINVGTIVYPLPRWKAQVHFDFTKGFSSFRWTTRYVSSYSDRRSAIFAYSAANQTGSVAECGGPTLTAIPTVVSARCGTVTAGQTIKASLIHDFTYRAVLDGGLTLTATVGNIFNTDPPFARTEYNYDAVTGEPLGRTFKFGIRKSF